MTDLAGRLGRALLFIAGLLLAGCNRQVDHSTPSHKKITVGIQVSPAMTLLMVAKDAGLFEQHGLDVELKQFTAGKFALQSFLGGSVDFAVSGDVPICLAVLQGNPVKVVAQVVEKTTNEVRIVALRPRSGAANLDANTYFTERKRKLATSFGGGPEFFTYQFLKHNRVQAKDVQILSQRPEDMPAALQARSLDAISIFDPFAFIAEQRLGKDAITFRNARLYSELYVITARQAQINEQGETITALLKALVDAQNFIAVNPVKAKQIMQRYTKLDTSVVNGIWNNFTFKATLGHQLIDDWTEETSWAKDTGKVASTIKVPDFRGVLETRFLKAVNPAGVQF